MKTSTKIIVSSAASLLGVALATGGAYAATGSLGVSDAPGQVLHVSGVGPASTHASDTAKSHANANARGIFGTPTAIPTPGATDIPGINATDAPKVNSQSEQGASSSINTATPVAPSVASKEASTATGNTTGKQIEAWAHAKSSVETVAPTGAVSVGVGANASVQAGH
jgi:hypothetical protein